MKRLLGLGYVLALVFTVACGRSDAGITTDVKAKLAADDVVKGYQVNVDTRDRVVTLTGTVDTLAAKSRAVALTREADGVRDVVDDIRVSDAVATTGRDLGDAAADTAREGADATSNGIRRGADAVADGVDRTKREAKDADVDDKAEEGKDAVSDGAKKVGSAAKKGAEAVADGAKKIGSGIRDAVTDKDRDSDNDGK
jgi:hypothetical protein